MLFCCYKRLHQKLSCLPLLYFILAVFVDSFEMFMIVVDDKSIFQNFIIQIHSTNHVSDIIYHGLQFCISAKILFQEKCIRISVILFHKQRESQRNCFEYNLTQLINQSIFFNKQQTYNITKIQNKSQPFTSKFPQERNLILICCV